jgi:hypothetical protein
MFNVLSYVLKLVPNLENMNLKKFVVLKSRSPQCIFLWVSRPLSKANIYLVYVKIIIFY